MRRHDQHGPGTENDLIEPQGVNAGPPIDQDPAAEEAKAEGTETGGDGGGPPGPPEDPQVTGALSDEMVGLPGHRPGYPGQERSVDTG